MRAALPLVAGVVLAAGAAALGHPWVAVGLLAAGVLTVQPALLRAPAPHPTGPPVHRRVGRTVGRGAGAVGHVAGAADLTMLRTVGAIVGTALGLLVFYLVLTPIGLLARLAGAPLLPSGDWRRRAPHSPATVRRSSVKAPTGSPLTGPGGPRLTWRTAIALVAVGACAAAVIPRVLDRSPDESAVPEQLRGASYNAFTSPALAGTDWLEEAGAEFGAVSAGLTYTSFVGNSRRDHEGRYVNVHDRRRRSYEPAPTGADPVDVWFFGGSTMFGFSAQRDLHTIPSEVVRLAEADGRAVRAHNFGSPGYVNMQETLLAAQLLAAEERPDLIVFYDGINDLALQFQQAFGGIGVVGDPSDLTAYAYRQQLAGQLTGSGEAPEPLVAVPEPGTPPSAAATIEALMRVYQRGRELALAFGEHYGIPAAHFWQPDLFNTSPLEPGEREVVRDLGMDDFRYDAVARIARAAVASLPDGVIDLNDAFAGGDGPVLTDQAHTNELGARLAAEAMYPSLAPALAELANGADGRVVTIAP